MKPRPGGGTSETAAPRGAFRLLPDKIILGNLGAVEPFAKTLPAKSEATAAPAASASRRRVTLRNYKKY
jgi:hypothetical protein